MPFDLGTYFCFFLNKKTAYNVKNYWSDFDAISCHYYILVGSSL